MAYAVLRNRFACRIKIVLCDYIEPPFPVTYQAKTAQKGKEMYWENLIEKFYAEMIKKKLHLADSQHVSSMI